MKKFAMMAFVGTTAMMVWNMGKRHKHKRIDKEIILNVLKQLETEVSKVLLLIARRANQIKENSIEIPNKENLKKIICNDPKFEEMIKVAELKVYKQFNVEEPIVQSFIENELKEDVEVNKIMKRMKNSLEEAYEGLIINEKSFIPYELTCSTALKAIEEIYDCELILWDQKRKMISERPGHDDEIDDCWEIDDEIDEKDTKCKIAVFRKLGFDIEKSNVNCCVRQMLKNFRLTDPEFREGLERAEKKFNTQMAKFRDSTINPEEVEYLKQKCNEYYLSY